MQMRMTIALGLAMLLGTAGMAAEEDALFLVDGTPIEGSDYHLEDDGVTMEDVWSIEEGMLICKGDPVGYVHTTQKFKNFKMTLEWRWAPGTEPGNNGVLLRIDGDAVTFLPKCIECQLKSGSAGDVYGFHGFKLTGDEERLSGGERDALGKFVGVKAMKNTEKKPGEWNTYDITLDGSDLTVKVNGQLVNKATDCEVLAGKIGLQSEGGVVHFRKIRITSLP